MMKKLSVFALVLGVASLATAGLTLVPSAIPVIPGETVTVKVIQDTPNFTGSGGEMFLYFKGDVVSVFDATPSVDLENSSEGYLWAFNGGAAIIPGGIWFAKIAQPNFGTYGIGSTDLFGNSYVSTIEFSFVPTETTDFVWGGVWDGVDMTGVVGATFVPWLVPEPATVTLLGFGLLALRWKSASSN